LWTAIESSHTQSHNQQQQFHHHRLVEGKKIEEEVPLAVPHRPPFSESGGMPSNPKQRMISVYISLHSTPKGRTAVCDHSDGAAAALHLQARRVIWRRVIWRGVMRAVVCCCARSIGVMCGIHRATI